MEFTGSTFEGAPHSGVIKMEGHGKYTFANGDIFIGEFKDGMFLHFFSISVFIYMHSIGFMEKALYI